MATETAKRGGVRERTDGSGSGRGRRRRLDTLPERAEYQDTGCGQGCERSLECPFPRCRFDDPTGWRQEARAARDREVARAHAVEGLTVDALAARFAVSRRTVHRILSEARSAAATGAA